MILHVLTKMQRGPSFPIGQRRFFTGQRDKREIASPGSWIKLSGHSSQLILKSSRLVASGAGGAGWRGCGGRCCGGRC